MGATSAPHEKDNVCIDDDLIDFVSGRLGRVRWYCADDPHNRRFLFSANQAPTTEATQTAGNDINVEGRR